jgi:type III restriction enzyme
MSVVEYDEGLVNSVATTLDLRRPNTAALDALARAMDGAEVGAELVADLATGVGKTYIAGGLLDYLFESGVRNVVIVTPGTTIQSKTIGNLTPGHRKYLRGLQSAPLVITIDDFERGTVGDALNDPNRFKVFILTIQSLLRPDTKENRRAHRPHETLGQSLSDYLRNADDLVIIADEHHVYFNVNAKRFRAAIKDLSPAVLIGLTATPHESTKPENIVYRYPLADAIADGYVKIPVLVARSDGAKDMRTQMADGIALLDAKAATMKAFCDRTGQTFVQPIFFVVSQTIDEANQLRDMLTGPDLLGSDKQVLLVTSDEPDETLRLLDTLEEPDSPIRAVVSVSMLKEGWDVKNIYVIAAVRALESQLLTEQILGRGMRLPFGHRTGVGMLDTLEVISHHAFADLLKHAEVLLTQTLGDRARDALPVVEGIPGVAGSPTSVGNLENAATAPSVTVMLPGSVADDAFANSGDDELALFGLDEIQRQDHVVVAFSTLEDRLFKSQATIQTLSRTLNPRQPNGVRIPLFIPRVSVRWVRDPFSLTNISTATVESLGRKFADDNAPTLIRKGLDARRGEDGVHIRITDLTDDPVAATQTLMPFSSIEIDLVQRLMNTNAVESSLREMNAATAIAHAFLIGGEVTEHTPWRVEHGRLATEALVRWIQAKQTSSPSRQVVEVNQVRWPEPEERIEVTPPANRHLITSSREFRRGYPYEGWDRSFYDVVTFDSYSAEFKLAELLEVSPGMKAWARVTSTVPLSIAYTTGATTRAYTPDFIVIDDQGTHWIVEGKADGEMTDTVVLAKRDAAVAWVNSVNASGDVAQKWAYLLVSETAVKNAGHWSSLKAAGQTFA